MLPDRGQIVRFFEADTWGGCIHPGGIGLTERLAWLAGIKKDSLVLDVACGKGMSPSFLTRQFHCRVLGIDISPKMIGQAIRHGLAQEAGERPAFLIGEAETLPIANDSVDVVLSECSFSLLKNKEQAAQEFWRVLREGGSLGIADFYLQPSSSGLDRPVHFLPCLKGAETEDTYRTLLSRCGFGKIHFEDHTGKLKEFLVDLILNFGSIGNFLEGFSPELYPREGRALAGAARKRTPRDGALKYGIITATKEGPAKREVS